MIENKRNIPVKPNVEDVISVLRSKIASIFKELGELKHRVGEISKDVRSLRDMFSGNDNWGSLAKKFVESGELVSLRDISGSLHIGKIIWVDRYNIGFKKIDAVNNLSLDGMFLKGGIVSIFPLTKE